MVASLPAYTVGLKSGIRNGEFEEEGEMDQEQFRDAKAAIDQARGQAERGADISLDEFDRSLRAEYGLSR